MASSTTSFSIVDVRAVLRPEGLLAAVPIAILIAATVLRWSSVQHWANQLLSKFLNLLLVHLYPIRHVESGAPLPTCAYQFPNGQGNVGKFLDGLDNSRKWGRAYGGLYRIWSGMSSEVVLTRPEYIKAIFRDSDRHAKAVDNNSGRIMHELLGSCLGLISGTEWKAVKAATEIPFQHSATRHYVSNIQSRVHAFFSSPSSPLGSSRTFTVEHRLDPVNDIKMLPFWIIADVIYGGLSPAMEADLARLAPQREALFRYVIHGGLTRFRVSAWLPLAANAELAGFKRAWGEFNAEAVQRAVAEGLDAPIVGMQRAVDEGRVSQDQLLQTLDEMLFANLDVTMGGLAWSIVFLAADGDVQGRVREEVGVHREKGQSAFEEYLLSGSSLLAACSLEASRLKPLAAFSVPQAAPSDRVVDGFRIPAYTNFVVDAYSLNVHNPFWGEDSAVYRPERFLERKGPELRYNYWRFGFGPRQCLGKYVADLVIHAITAYLVENYTLDTNESPEEWKRIADTWISHPQTVLQCKKRSKGESI